MTQEDSWLSVQAVEAWWASPNQSAIKRPYPASAVAAIRDIYPENSRSNAMGLKLRRILDKHQAAKSINITTSPMDLMSQKMMADVGMETVYVSGGVASLTAVEDPGTDYVSHAVHGGSTPTNQTRLITPTTRCPERSVLPSSEPYDTLRLGSPPTPCATLDRPSCPQ